MSQSSKNAVLGYFQESFQELKKVTWPTRHQAIRLTLIVLGFCLFAAVFLGVLDLAFNQGYKTLVDYAAKVAPPAVTAPAATDTSATTPAVPTDAVKVDGVQTESGAPVKVTPVPVTDSKTPAPAPTPSASDKK